MKRYSLLGLIGLLLTGMLVRCSHPATVVQVMELPVITLQAGDYLPELPKQVDAAYSNGKQATIPVEKWNTGEWSGQQIWQSIAITGKVQGTDLLANLQILVKDQLDIGLSPTKAAASNAADLMENQLKDNPTVQLRKFSPNRSVACYVTSDGNGQEIAWLWHAGDCYPRALSDTSWPCHEVQWTADGKLLYLLSSTDVVVTIDVIDSTANNKLKAILSFEKAAWAPSNHELLVALPNKVQTVIPVGNGCSYDLAIYNADTGTTKVVLPGTADSIYSIVGWDGPNTVVYDKSNLAKGMEQQGLRLTVTR